MRAWHFVLMLIALYNNENIIEASPSKNSQVQKQVQQINAIIQKDSAKADSIKNSKDVKQGSFPQSHITNSPKWYNHPQICAAIIQAVTLIVVSLIGGLWMNKRQGKWEEIRIRERTKYNWKYDMFDSLDKTLIEIQELASKYEKSYLAITELSDRKPDADKSLYDKHSENLTNIRKDLLEKQEKLSLLQRKSKFLFENPVSKALESILQNISIFSSLNTVASDHKVSEVKKNIDMQIGIVLDLILKELSASQHKS